VIAHGDQRIYLAGICDAAFFDVVDPEEGASSIPAK